MGGAGMAETLLQVEDLAVHYPVKSGLLVDRTVGYVYAVDDVSLQIARGRRLGAYDALQAENPVWLCSFNFSSEEEK